MKLGRAIEVLKANSMACWWPDKGLGRNTTDLDGMVSEILGHMNNIKWQQDIPSDAVFFVLDDAAPETALYNELAAALCTLKRCCYLNPRP